jgi:hypothetical protein
MGTNANGVQLIGNGLGSPGSGKCSRSGGPVLDNQEMVLAVGTFLPRMGFTNAHLNVESKFGATLEQALTGSGFTSAANLPNSGDNGPDFGDGDNKAVDIVGPASSLSIRPAGWAPLGTTRTSTSSARFRTPRKRRWMGMQAQCWLPTARITRRTRTICSPMSSSTESVHRQSSRGRCAEHDARGHTWHYFRRYSLANTAVH